MTDEHDRLLEAIDGIDITLSKINDTLTIQNDLLETLVNRIDGSYQGFREFLIAYSKHNDF